MGKYMRKEKGVGKMEVSQNSLVGVRTRARALALEKEKILGNLSLLRHSFTTSATTASSSKASGSSSQAHPTQPLYMELRSRRLEKGVRNEKDKGVAETLEVSQASVRELCKNRSSSRLFLPLSAELRSIGEERCRFWLQAGSCSVQGSDSTSHNRLPPRSPSLCKPVAPTASSNHSLGNSTISIAQKKPLGILTRNRRQELACSSALNSEAAMEVYTALESLQPVDLRSKRDMDAELCFGESPMVAGFSSRDRECEPSSRRKTRECTPDSIIRDVEAPGSTSRTRSPSQARPLSAPVFARCSEAPSSSEIDAFFSSVEHQERRRFINRYNFDPLLERPLKGRYEWLNM